LKVDVVSEVGRFVGDCRPSRLWWRDWYDVAGVSQNVNNII
jgi:hypothetical protein